MCFLFYVLWNGKLHGFSCLGTIKVGFCKKNVEESVGWSVVPLYLWLWKMVTLVFSLLFILPVVSFFSFINLGLLGGGLLLFSDAMAFFFRCDIFGGVGCFRHTIDSIGGPSLY